MKIAWSPNTRSKPKAAPIQASWPRDEHPMNRDERIAFQTGLSKLGYDIGTIDGVLGRKARAATRDFQLKHDGKVLPPDSHLGQAAHGAKSIVLDLVFKVKPQG